MAKRDKDVITLGSGKLYVMLYDAEDGIPEDATIETEENRIGWIKGGATLTYTPEFYRFPAQQNWDPFADQPIQEWTHRIGPDLPVETFVETRPLPRPDL